MQLGPWIPWDDDTKKRTICLLCSAGELYAFLFHIQLWNTSLSSLFFFFKILFIFRERGREGEKISMCGCLLHTLNGGPGPQCKHMPWLGIEPATFQFTGRHSLHWATPARAFLAFLKIKLSSKSVLFLLKTTLETHHKEKQHKQWNWRASVLVNLKQAVRGGTLKVTKGCYYLSRTLSHTSPESSGGGTWEGS